MSREAKTLSLAALVGGVGGCFFAGFVDAVRAGNNFAAVLCAALFLAALLLMRRIIQHLSGLKGRA